MDDLISRAAAIDALKICDNNEDGINCHKCPLRDERWDGAWQDNETNCYRKLMRDSAKLLELPSVQPKEVIPHRNYKYLSDYWCECGNHLGKKGEVKYCSDCGRKVKWDE